MQTNETANTTTVETVAPALERLPEGYSVRTYAKCYAVFNDETGERVAPRKTNKEAAAQAYLDILAERAGAVEQAELPVAEAAEVSAPAVETEADPSEPGVLSDEERWEAVNAMRAADHDDETGETGETDAPETPASPREAAAHRLLTANRVAMLATFADGAERKRAKLSPDEQRTAKSLHDQLGLLNFHMVGRSVVYHFEMAWAREHARADVLAAALAAVPALAQCSEE